MTPVGLDIQKCMCTIFSACKTNCIQQKLKEIKDSQRLHFSSSALMHFCLTMLAEMLHHPPHHQRHPILQQPLVSQLKQRRSKHLGVLGCDYPGSRDGHLDHLLHVFFNLHRRLVVLQGEQTAAVRHWHYGSRDRHLCRHLLHRKAHFIPKSRMCVLLLMKWLTTHRALSVTLPCSYRTPCAEGSRKIKRRAGCAWVATTNIRLPRNTSLVKDTARVTHIHTHAQIGIWAHI